VNRRLVRIVASAGLLALASSGYAQQISCGVSAVGVVFGSYDTLAASPTYGTGRVDVGCTLIKPPGADIAYTIALSPGASGSYAARTMLATGFALQYNLYVAAPPSISVWGNGTGTTQMVAGVARLRPPPGRTTTVSHTLYGTIPARQDVAAGAYVDTIVVTLTF
jgi:spore coat protein U-like protein